MKAKFEPFWWSLFGAGGVMSAFFLPALMIVFGLAIPLGWITAPDHATITSYLEPLAVRVVLLAVFTTSLIHWAHRFRFTLHEGLQLHAYHRPIAIFCYGSAVALSAYATYLMLIKW